MVDVDIVIDDDCIRLDPILELVGLGRRQQRFICLHASARGDVDVLLAFAFATSFRNKLLA